MACNTPWSPINSGRTTEARVYRRDMSLEVEHYVRPPHVVPDHPLEIHVENARL